MFIITEYLYSTDFISLLTMLKSAVYHWIYNDSRAFQLSVRWDYLSIPKLQWLCHWKVGMDKWFHLTLYNGCVYLFMMGFKFNHVSKRGPRWTLLYETFKMTWKRFPHSWHFVGGIHWSPFRKIISEWNSKFLSILSSRSVDYEPPLWTIAKEM